jgi:hypothetical protein
VDTVLGVSITSTGVGWVLADGSADDDATLDHDAFDVEAGDTSQHAVAVRGAQAIAAATGNEIRSIGLTYTHDAETAARQLLQSLRESGYDNLVEVRLPQAAKAWVQGIGRELGYQSAAVCVVEPAAVTLLTVDAVGAVQIDVTQSRDSASADGLGHWLSEVLNGDRREPDSLLLLGSRSDRDQLTDPLDEALPMPVISTAEAQLVLARGAALALAIDTVATSVVEPEVEDDEIPGKAKAPRGASWISSHTRMIATIATGALVVVAIGFLAVLPRLLAEEYPSPTDSPAGAAVSTPTRAPVSAPPASAYRIPLPTAPPPPVQPLVAEPPLAPPIPTEVPESLAVPVPEVEVIEDVPASPEIVEQVAVVNEPEAPPAPVAVVPEPVVAAAVAPGPEALAPAPPPPPSPNPAPSVLSPLFGALP